MADRFAITVPIAIRPCRKDDLANLEWFGQLRDDRQIIADTFERSQRGEIMMLVAEANHFPIGQVWIELTKRRQEAIGILWALRVLTPFRNQGIGTQLITSAEAILAGQGLRTSELGVEKDNPRARCLYERLGYAVVRDHVEEWDVTPPDGTTKHVVIHEWIMHKSLMSSEMA